jgi:hypothetical protein
MTASTTIDGDVMTDDTIDTVSKAMRRAWQLGQTYWQQADSDSYKQQDKSDETQKKFEALVDETRALLSASKPAAPEGCTPADAKMLRDANHSLATENDQLRRALAPFARLVSTDTLSWAMVEYTVQGDPEKQTFQRPQMQRAFNRAAGIMKEGVPVGDAADISTLDLPDWVTNGKPPAEPAQSGEAVAQYQTKLRNPILPSCDVWINVSEEGARTAREKYSHVYEVRELFERAAAPQPSQPVEAGDDWALPELMAAAGFTPDERSNSRIFNAVRAVLTDARAASPQATVYSLFSSSDRRNFGHLSPQEFVNAVIEAVRAQATATQPCIAPGCYQWDGTDSCTCKKATATQPEQTDDVSKMIADIEAEQTFLGSSRDMCSEYDKPRWDRLQVIADHLSQKRGA